ncbi:hypothetical protein N7492_003047 [Penicillium capsulatum]|uniref:Uncharacterized protein n=1 Tax=Penicillium capsulatum TaxID=69766 RepID=A0A9W9IL49_9EURO|nr:hypothetical protein N7492_003047 [Penicillium capsulatum]KAJ6122362.1 hypothetical protein N7512_004827 [Penicillium capsulatum]
MAQRQLSRTLPKNFTFPSLSVDEPKTPERPSTTIDVPPPPRHSFSSCRLPRVRVRSGTDVCARMDLDLFQFRGNSDVPLPSIEVPPASASLDASFSDEPSNDERYLAPPRQRMDFKTPPAQIRGTPFDSNDSNLWPSWEQTPLAHHITRPDSACSNVSDSSNESIETFASRPSVGGSCSSIESDIFEPYFPLELPKEPEMESPTLPKQRLQRPQVMDTSWTREMDNHLWNTYQMYLQDPTMTPFKMTPGSIPPLGVTSRVARRAKKTWEKKSQRITSICSVDRSASSTPKAMDGVQSAWPKSDAKTRKRLKMLCRRKFSINPHYQRMMQSRSPEPVADMLQRASQARVSGPANSSPATYGTRDLGVSLVTSYAPTPLAQLAEASSPNDSSMDWFNNPVQHRTLQSIAHAPNPYTQSQDIPRLGSPFVYSTWGPGGSNRQVDNNNAPTAPRRGTVHVPVARRVRRNTHFQRTSRDPRDVDDVFSSDAHSSKERTEDDFHSRLEKYVHDKKFQDIGHGRVRVRSRGATTGAVGSRDVNQLFSPPSSLNSSHAEETTPVAKPPVNSRLNLGGENIKRLGSPFKLDGGFKRRDGPARFIRHAPSLSDPFSSGGIPMFQGPTSNPSPMQEQITNPTPSLQNPFEEGLSDAERIRRQILNMPFTRE